MLNRVRFDINAVPASIVEVPCDGIEGGVVGARVDIETRRCLCENPVQQDVLSVLRVGNLGHAAHPLPSRPACLFEMNRYARQTAQAQLGLTRESTRFSRAPYQELSLETSADLPAIGYEVGSMDEIAQNQS